MAAQKALLDLYERCDINECRLCANVVQKTKHFGAIQSIVASLRMVGFALKATNVKIVIVGGYPEFCDKKEIKAMYKQPPCEVLGPQTPKVLRVDSKEPALCIVCDRHGNVGLLHLQNVFSEYEIELRANVRKNLVKACHKGWMKGCGLSGDLNYVHVKRDIEKKKIARTGYFGEHEEEYGKKVQINPTYQGKGATAKAMYTNRQGKEIIFQIGNYLRRCVVEGTDPKLGWQNSGNGPKNNFYLNRKLELLNAVGDSICWPDDMKTRGGLSKHVRMKSIADTSPRNSSFAMNLSVSGDSTAHSLHWDGRVFGACITSSEPGRHELSSAGRIPGADAGEFFHEFGGLVHGCGSRDAFIFNGCYLHAGLMPHAATKRHQKKNKKLKAQRYSYVLFRSSATDRRKNSYGT